MATRKFERLPSTVKPVSYNLTLKTDLHKLSFDGKEIISIKITEPVDNIVLNCLDLDIQTVELKQSDGELIKPQINLNAENETLTLKLPKIVASGDAQLEIYFAGILNNNMKGFYRSKYTKVTEKDNEFFAVTQLCATDARRCFPCWDEPAIKAFFDITLIVDVDKLALSNMPVDYEKIENGLKIVKFQRSPKMSTYLVAFVVGNFDYVEDKSSDGVLVRVYTPLGKKEQGRFALEVATKTLPYYKDYFQIAYPLPKMDLIAISEISPSAMENWGLITYRETRLLVDEKNTSSATKQSVAIVVGHELAHMWFGNLVTMEWWTHLWLNEGYASFVEYLCVAHLFPEFDIWTQFVTDLYCRGLELDSLANSHPVEVPINHPSEIDEIFDDISYAKGGSVIRMIYRYIGDEDFRKGMNLYLTRHQYGITFTEDLWAALEEASSKPIKTVMPTWTKQKGFPLITVESSKYENNALLLTISQKMFGVEEDVQDDSLWFIPLSFCKASKPDEECFSTILKDRRSTITIPNVDEQEWVKLNFGTVGFYRTKYSTDLLLQMIPSINDKSLPPLDRFGLLYDLFTLVQIGQTNAPQVLELMRAMKDEDNYVVWHCIAVCLKKIQNLLSSSSVERLYSIYGLQLVKPIYSKLGPDPKPGENHVNTLFRSLVLNLLVNFGDPDFLEIAVKRFDSYCKDETVIPADLRSVIYKAVISVRGKAAFDSLIDMYKKTDLLEEKERILQSFSAITDPNLVDSGLEFAQSV